jgi:hypothetical protein
MGAAVIMQWEDLPTDIQRQLFEHAISMGKLHHTVELKGQIARLLHRRSRQAPGAAATIRSFSARDHRRRCCTDVITSTCCLVMVQALGLILGLAANPQARKVALTECLRRWPRSLNDSGARVTPQLLRTIRGRAAWSRHCPINGQPEFSGRRGSNCPAGLLDCHRGHSYRDAPS